MGGDVFWWRRKSAERVPKRRDPLLRKPTTGLPDAESERWTDSVVGCRGTPNTMACPYERRFRGRGELEPGDLPQAPPPGDSMRTIAPGGA